MNSEKLNNFERAFSSKTSGCFRECKCGVVYYDTFNKWDWGEGELEGLLNDSNAKGVDYAVGGVSVNGVEYCNACSCWHGMAVKVMTFLDEHGGMIAEYFRLEKSRRLAEADSAPLVDVSAPAAIPAAHREP